MEPGDTLNLTLRRLFLRRLSRLVVLEARVLTPQERWLVQWAMYSTCHDCYDLGLREEIQRILAERRPRPTGPA